MGSFDDGASSDPLVGNAYFGNACKKFYPSYLAIGEFAIPWRPAPKVAINSFPYAYSGARDNVLQYSSETHCSFILIGQIAVPLPHPLANTCPQKIQSPKGHSLKNTHSCVPSNSYTLHKFPLHSPNCFTPTELPESPMDLNDEDFIRKFAALNSGRSKPPAPVSLPQEEETTKNWSLCLAVRVITDRTVLDEGFTAQMLRAWKPTRPVKISSSGNCIYIAEFSSSQDYMKVLNEGPWQYRTDQVAVERIDNPLEIKNCPPSHVEIWTQIHGRFVEFITAQGVQRMVKELGTIVSHVSPTSSGGRRFLRTKIRFPATAKLLDSVEAELSSMGCLDYHLVYERLGRHCTYCAQVGHDINMCAIWSRLCRLAMDPRYADNEELQNLNPIQIGPWITSAELFPEEEPRHASNTRSDSPRSTPAARTRETHPGQASPGTSQTSAFHTPSRPASQQVFHMGVLGQIPPVCSTPVTGPILQNYSHLNPNHAPNSVIVHTSPSLNLGNHNPTPPTDLAGSTMLYNDYQHSPTSANIGTATTLASTFHGVDTGLSTQRNGSQKRARKAGPKPPRVVL